jgi:hypothetical protein
MTAPKAAFPPRLSFKNTQTAILIGDYQNTPEWTSYISQAEHAATIAAMDERLRVAVEALEKYKFISANDGWPSYYSDAAEALTKIRGADNGS